MRKLLIAAILLTLSFGGATAQENDDALGRLLAEVGFTRDDLGYRPAGYWNRFPLDIPYRLTSFDALFAEPLKLVDYATVMANTVELYLDPKRADSTDDGLYKLVYNLGVDKRRGGFRSYSANLLEAPATDQPLLIALDQLYRIAGHTAQPSTFGSPSEWPSHRGVLQGSITLLPDSAKTIIARLVANLAEAIHWRQLAFRNCDRDDMQSAFMIRDLADTQTDGTVYYPELDDLAGSIDLPSLHYAALKVSAAAEQAEQALQSLPSPLPDRAVIDIPTPFGRIVLVGSGNSKSSPHPLNLALESAAKPGWIEIDANNSLLVIDFGSQTFYRGTAGANSSLNNPISVLIDLGGDDYYGLENDKASPSAGVGLLGVGLVIDSKGDDHYYGSRFAQGAGLFGVGVLLDRIGNDHYRAEVSAQGAGYFGIGLCFDGTGDDTYYLYGDGQGMGGVGGGVGVCASYAGRDKYTAEPLSEVADRGDYHSEHKINGNNAQGSGFGRRGDGSDGHAWAGGLGAIIDIDGDDHYYSGNWTLGVGYWFATGIAIDRAGNDIYESCYFTQGSGAHFCNGILIDEAGDDRHELYETAGAGLGFGWDYTNAFLINKGGDDSYRAKIISMGLAQIRSNAFLIDIEGNDRYYLGRGTAGLGEATYRPDYDHPSRLTPYYSYAKSIGGFIDMGGVDSYFEFDDTSEVTHTAALDNALWLQPSRTDSTFGANNYGVGLDTDHGTIPELIKWTN